VVVMIEPIGWITMIVVLESLSERLIVPELPEVETMVRGIRPHIEYRTIDSLNRCPCQCRPISMKPSFRQIAKRVAGQTVGSVRRIGKRVIIDLNSGDSMVIEPRMTGLMLVTTPPNKSHLRLHWTFIGDDSVDLWFWDRRGLGTFALFPTEELQVELDNRLGPDALSITEHQWITRCSATGRAIKVAMLDQKFVAGIGNLYASEILNLSKVSPTKPANNLKREQVRRIHQATLKVLKTAIRYEGSTLGDGTYRNAMNKDGGYQNHHRVYALAGERCPGCKRGRIRRIVQAQRSTFYCGVCQR
jgi:formamidopyrimidine-DNA glycosylase